MSKGRDESKNPYKCFYIVYDEKNDILDICVNNRWKKVFAASHLIYGDECPDGTVTFFYDDTGEIEGYKVFDFMKKLKSKEYKKGGAK